MELTLELEVGKKRGVEREEPTAMVLDMALVSGHLQPIRGQYFLC